MNNNECKCKTPNYNAFTGRCMTCGGFHKKDKQASTEPNTQPPDKVCFDTFIHNVQALVYYSQIHTVTGVQPVELPSHNDAWRVVQKWLWDNCKADEVGVYKSEYATKLQLCDARLKELQLEWFQASRRNIEMRYLLEKVISSPHSCWAANEELYNEIKTFLDGK
jgi:hypothetical protein